MDLNSLLDAVKTVMLLCYLSNPEMHKWEKWMDRILEIQFPPKSWKMNSKTKEPTRLYKLKLTYFILIKRLKIYVQDVRLREMVQIVIEVKDVRVTYSNNLKGTF